MSRRLLIIISIAVFVIAVSGATIIWISVRSRTTLPKSEIPTANPISGFPISSPPPPPPLVIPAPMPPSPAPVPTSPPEPALAPIPTPTPATANSLIKLSSTPVAGAILISASNTALADLLYVEEGTGNLFRADPNGQNNQRLTDSSIPGVIKTWWGGNRETLTLFAQYLNNQEVPTTFRGTYKPPSATSMVTDVSTITSLAQLVGGIIPNVIAGGIAISPSRDRFFSLLETATGVTGTITELATGKVRTVFASPFQSWTIAWSTAKAIALVPKAAVGTPGTIYFLNPNTNDLAPILSGRSGFTALVSPSGTKILFNEELGPLKIYSVRDNKIQPLIITTLPEKCVWAIDTINVYCAVPNAPPVAQYPDDWWQGEITFNDSLWQVNTETGEARIIWSNNTGGNNKSLDIIDLLLDEPGKRLIFTDRWSGYLWSLRQP